jgi:hypothetical protein
MQSLTATWTEGDNGLAPEDEGYQPAIDQNGQARITVIVADTQAFPEGWSGYVPNNPFDKAGTTIGLWKAFGAPV